MADARRVKLGSFGKLGLKNSFAIVLSLQCQRNCAGPSLQPVNVYVNVYMSERTVYVTAKDTNLSMKDLSRSIF